MVHLALAVKDVPRTTKITKLNINGYRQEFSERCTHISYLCPSVKRFDFSKPEEIEDFVRALARVTHLVATVATYTHSACEMMD